MTHFGDVKPFLEVLKESSVAPATTDQLLAVLDDEDQVVRLMVQLAAVVDVGQHFVRATYWLEGDGALFFSCYRTLQAVTAV